MFFKNKFFLFLSFISLLTFFLFWQVFIQKKIPFNANLLASFYNPWAQEKFLTWESGIPNKPTAKDDLWIFYPQRTFTTNVLKTGELPFWNPYSFAGNYHLGLSETAVFYPLNFLFLFFSQIDVWTLLTVIEFPITGFGMYLFLKRIVLNEKSAILGAFAFAFSGIVVVRAVEGLSVGHTLIWMPYVFWGIEAFLQTKKIRFLWAMLLSLVFSLLSGWFQFTFYIFILGFIYSLFKLFSKKKFSKASFLVLVPFLLLPIVTLFHTLPSLQALLEAPRIALEGRVFSYRHLMPLSHLLTLIIPDFWGNPATYTYFGKSDYKEGIMFIGAVPFIFSVASMLKRKSKGELFFLGTIAFSFILAFDNPLSKLIISLPIPIFGSFLPNRIFLLSTFSLCVLAAFGLDYILKQGKNVVLQTIRKTFFLLLPIVVLLIFSVSLPILKDLSLLNQVDRTGINTSHEAIRFKNLIIPMAFFFSAAIIFFIFRRKYSKNIFFFLIIAILFLQNYIFAQKFIPFSNRDFVYPSHPVFDYLKKDNDLDRFISLGRGHIVPSIPLQFGTYSPEGIGSMYIRRYGELVRYMKLGDFGIPDKIAFDLPISPSHVFSPENNRLNRFFELASVKYIVVDKKSMEEEKVIPDKKLFSLSWENARPARPERSRGEKWQIYQYQKSMPRFFTTSNFEIVTDKEMILKALFSTSFVPNKIILEENPGFTPKDYSGHLSVTKYSPNKISMEVTADNPTLIYFSDNYSKAFKVTIDGKEGKILRANYTFRAIPMSSGKHRVDVFYDNRGVIFGFTVAAITIVIALLLSTIYTLRKQARAFKN